jgi:hypothetical protein
MAKEDGDFIIKDKRRVDREPEVSEKEKEEKVSRQAEVHAESKPVEETETVQEEWTKGVPPASDFRSLITMLGMQAFATMGIMANPVTNKVERNIEQAKYLIDTVEMLREKTKGNLTREEETVIEDLLYQLHTSYVYATRE